MPTAKPHSVRGQSMVEFGMLLPILMVLLLGTIDFGRVFHAGIVAQSAAREAAEAAALEYLRTPPAPLGSAAPTPGDPAYYDAIHEVAAETACRAARDLPNADYSGGQCATWPAVLVCVHDGADPSCGSTITGYASTPAGCDGMSSPAWTNSEEGGANGGRYVEVRVCYRFTTLFDLDLALPFSAGLSLGEVYLEQRAIFSIADY